MDFDTLYKKVKAIDIKKLKVEAIKEKETEIIRLDQDQLFSGRSGLGGNIKPKYKSSIYAGDKHEQNPVPGVGTPDLFKTGAMFRGMNLKVNSRTVLIKSNVRYFSKLKGKYRAAFELQKKNIKKINATGELIRLYKKELGI